MDVTPPGEGPPPIGHAVPREAVPEASGWPLFDLGARSLELSTPLGKVEVLVSGDRLALARPFGDLPAGTPVRLDSAGYVEPVAEPQPVAKSKPGFFGHFLAKGGPTRAEAAFGPGAQVSPADVAHAVRVYPQQSAGPQPPAPNPRATPPARPGRVVELD